MMTYTKRDIVRRVAEANNDPMIKVEPWVDSVIVALREIMMSADTECRIEIRDFGVFEVKETMAEPIARIPTPKEVIYVPVYSKTHFKPCKMLKQFLREPLEDEDTKG